MNAGEIEQNSEQGKLLQQVVLIKLRDFLGPAYNDEVLPLYIVVMLAHGNPEKLVAESLEAFLGADQANTFATWYDQTPFCYMRAWNTCIQICVSSYRSVVCISIILDVSCLLKPIGHAEAFRSHMQG